MLETIISWRDVCILLGIDQSVKLSVTEKRSLLKKIIVFRSYNSLYDETCLKLFHSVLFRQRRNKFYTWRIRENFFMPFFYFEIKRRAMIPLKSALPRLLANDYDIRERNRIK